MVSGARSAIGLIDFQLERKRRRQSALLSLLRGHRMKALLRRMLDETQFLSERGVRSLSKVHKSNRIIFGCAAALTKFPIWPAESNSRLFGGNFKLARTGLDADQLPVY